jgi:hypothetical protein
MSSLSLKTKNKKRKAAAADVVRKAALQAAWGAVGPGSWH